MTREEAVKIFNTLLSFGRCDCQKGEIPECLKMAIKALEQQPCEDAISRQALIERINNAEENFKSDNMESIASDDGDPFVDGVLSGVFNIRQMVMQAPTVTPQPKVGHWIRVELGLFDSVSIRWECSECKKSDRFRSNFCFNCGARMESEVLHEDSD